MNHHTVQELTKGPAAGRHVYVCSNRREGSYVECCADVWLQLAELPDDERDSSPLWEQVGHATRDEAYAHMRERLLAKLRLDGQSRDWSGCRAPADGGKCDVPTKGLAEIPGAWFLAPLCDTHRTREVVEAMWDGPGDMYGSL